MTFAVNGGKMKESEIQKAVIDYLRLKGWFVWKNNQAGIYKKETGSYIPLQVKGVADLTAIKDGKVVFIEVKTGKGKLSDHQEAFRKAIVKAGGFYVISRGVLWERHCSWLSSIFFRSFLRSSPVLNPTSSPISLPLQKTLMVGVPMTRTPIAVSLFSTLSRTFSLPNLTSLKC